MIEEFDPSEQERSGLSEEALVASGKENEVAARFGIDSDAFRNVRDEGADRDGIDEAGFALGWRWDDIEDSIGLKYGIEGAAPPLLQK